MQGKHTTNLLKKQGFFCAFLLVFTNVAIEERKSLQKILKFHEKLSYLLCFPPFFRLIYRVNPNTNTQKFIVDFLFEI